MDIREVIRNAREVISLPGVVVARHGLAESLGDRLDFEAEQVLANLLPKFSEGFRAVSVLPTLLDIIAQKIGKNLSVREMDVREADVPLYGYVENFDTEAIIKIRPGMNTCWKRFTVLKELMHLYSNTCNDSAEGDKASLIVMAARRSRNVIARDNTILGNEEAAFYMALEVLIPWEKSREQLIRLRELGATQYQIAKVYMLPTPMVSHFLEDDEEKAPYIELSRRLNKNI